MNECQYSCFIRICKDFQHFFKMIYFFIFSAQLHTRNHYGETVLHLCAKLNQTECMKLLLRVTPDLVNDENDQKQTALEIAQQNGHEICVELVRNILVNLKVLLQIHKRVITEDMFRQPKTCLD